MTTKKGSEGIDGVSTMTAMQKRFFKAWLETSNAAHAAREAGYSPRTDPYNILNGVKMQRHIKDYWKSRGMGPDEIAARLSQQARAEYAVYILADGTVDLAKMIADGKAGLIKSVKKTQWGTNIEFHDAQSALVHMGRVHKMFTDKTEHSGSVERPITVIDYGLDDDLDDDLEADDSAE